MSLPGGGQDSSSHCWVPPAEHRRYTADDVSDKKDELHFYFSFLNTGYLCGSVSESNQGLGLFYTKKSAA